MLREGEWEFNVAMQRGDAEAAGSHASVVEKGLSVWSNVLF
jgi:hypothetical protein